MAVDSFLHEILWLLLYDSDLSCCLFHQDGNGYIDEQELDALLKDLCDKNKMVMNS